MKKTDRPRRHGPGLSQIMLLAISVVLGAQLCSSRTPDTSDPDPVEPPPQSAPAEQQ